MIRADREAELADPRATTPGEGGLDAVDQRSVSAICNGSTVERGDRLVRDLEQPPRHADLHDDRHVGDERARLVKADDGEVLRPDPDRLADLLRRAIGVRVVAGDPRADHDVVPTDVTQVEEPSPAAFLGQDRRRRTPHP